MTGEQEKSGFAGLSSLIKDVESPVPDSERVASKLTSSPNQSKAASAAPNTPPRPSAPSQPPRPAPRPIFPSEPTPPSGTGPWSKLLIGFAVVATLIGGLHFASRERRAVPAGSAQASLPQAAPSPPPSAPKTWAHVTAKRANVRAAPGTSAKVVGSLTQLTQVEVLGFEGSWTKISLSGTAPTEGFVSSSLLHQGSAIEAKALVCDVAGSVRPRSGEILSQSRRGQHKITVTAGAEDALVKLRSGKATSLSFYVRAHETGVVSTVPNGTYTIMFASGTGFSRKCLEFVTKMDVISDPDPQVFEVTSDGSYRYTSEASYTLTQVAGGNMRPRDTNPDAFRE